VIEIFARSAGMREAVRLADRVAATDANVLISGESGAGKDALALYIHSRSPRSSAALVKIDCATLPGGLLEAELFGFEKGAFTGATEAKPGRLEAAHGGTLILDEIAHFSVDGQAKLLRVIETREFERLGGRRTVKVNARLIALTNVDLEQAVKRRDFREDLFFRLNVVHISVPPLRERAEDLSKLASYFLEKYSAKHGRKTVGLTAAALKVLQTYDFPGNVRELANVIERAVILADGRRVDAKDFPTGFRAAAQTLSRREQPLSLAEVEAEYIAETLAATRGNKSEAARILGISRKNLYERLARTRRDDGEGTKQPR
jgi:DNA-binding NtrC family response regulator